MNIAIFSLRILGKKIMMIVEYYQYVPNFAYREGFHREKFQKDPPPLPPIVCVLKRLHETPPLYTQQNPSQKGCGAYEITLLSFGLEVIFLVSLMVTHIVMLPCLYNTQKNTYWA